MSDALRDLPDALRSALLRRVPTQLPDAEAMKRRVWRAVKEAERARSAHPFLNLALARDLAERLDTLIDRTADGTETQRGLVAAAIVYFATVDDLHPDYDDAFGFDDDAQVIAAVEQVIEDDAALAEPRAAR